MGGFSVTGAILGVDPEQAKQKRDLKDAQRKDEITKYMGISNNIHKSLALLMNPDTMQPLPGKEQEVAGLRQNLAQVDAYVKNLYNPNFDVTKGAMTETPIHRLGDILHITKQPANTKPVGEQVKDLQAISERFSSDPKFEPDLLTPDEQRKAAKINAGLEPKAAVEKPGKSEYKLYKVNGKPQWIDISDHKNIPAGAEAIVPRSDQEKPPSELSPEALAALGDNWKRNGIKPPSKYIAEVETYLNEKFPGWKPPVVFKPTPPKPYGQPYQRDGKWYVMINSGGTNFAEKELPQGFSGKDTPAIAKAKKDYLDAVALSSTADQVAQNPNDAVNQKRLAVSLERASAGRFTTQALDYIIKAGWGNTLEQWANNPTTGALPSDVLRQLVDGAHQLLKSKKDALDTANQLSGGSTGGGNTGGGKKRVSLKKAMAMPQNKGKSEAKVRSDIESHGYEVTQ